MTHNPHWKIHPDGMPDAERQTRSESRAASVATAMMKQKNEARADGQAARRPLEVERQELRVLCFCIQATIAQRAHCKQQR